MRQFYNEPAIFFIRVRQSSVSLSSGILESVEGERRELGRHSGGNRG